MKFSPVYALVLLAACGGLPADNELRVDNDGNGRFSGTAGAGWTAEEIRRSVCAPGQLPVEFNVYVLPSEPTIPIFNGRCPGATAIDSQLSQIQGQSAPVVTASPVSPSGSPSGYVSPYETGYTPPPGFYDN